MKTFPLVELYSGNLKTHLSSKLSVVVWFPELNTIGENDPKLALIRTVFNELWTKLNSKYLCKTFAFQKNDQNSLISLINEDHINEDHISMSDDGQVLASIEFFNEDEFTSEEASELETEFLLALDPIAKKAGLEYSLFGTLLAQELVHHDVKMINAGPLFDGGTANKCGNCHQCLKHQVVHFGPIEVSESMARMILCPECGNKRCPKANDHRHECTGSNEPGQAGSAYPDIFSNTESSPCPGTCSKATN